MGGVIEGDPGGPPSGAAPFMRLRIGVGDGERVITRFTTTFVPDAGLMQAEDGSWLRPDAATVSALRELARGQRLFPASALRLPAAAALPARRRRARAPRRRPDAAGAGDGLPVWLIADGRRARWPGLRSSPSCWRGARPRAEERHRGERCMDRRWRGSPRMPT